MDPFHRRLAPMALTADVTTGLPSLAPGLAKARKEVRQMAFTPDGRMAYAANSDEVGTISVYRVGPQGRLRGAGTVKSGGDSPVGIVVTPRGRMLYVAHVFSSTIAAFTIAADGSLKPFRTITPSVPDARGLAMTPDGRFLYAGHGDPTETRPDSIGAITTYAVNRDGSLTEVGSPIRVGKFCGAEAITPDGRRLYLICQDTDEIHGFAIGASGGLTPLPAYGDGTTQTTAGPRTTHAYPRAGTFRATVTVTDDEGCSTALISTGQAVLCNGSAAATKTRDIAI